MSSKEGDGKPDGRVLRWLRLAALIAALAGGAGSVGFMLLVGHRNRSLILLVLFAIWVSSPFIGVLVASVVSKSWPVLTQARLYGVMLVLTAGSLAVYGDVAFGTPLAKPASVFLIAPLLSWLLVAIIVAIPAFISGRLSRQDEGPPTHRIEKNK